MTPDPTGAALVELSVLERSQPRGNYLIDAIDARGGLLVVSGPHLTEFELTAPVTAESIRHRLLPFVPGLADVDDAVRGSYPRERDVWSAWIELHHDLGSVIIALTDEDLRLHYSSIVRVGDTARITVSDGVRAGTMSIDLRARMPSAVPVDLIQAFRARSPAMSFFPDAAAGPSNAGA